MSKRNETQSDPAEFEKFDIVVLSRVKWELAPSIPEHTVKVLKTKNRILVVEPLLSLPTAIREARFQNRRWEASSGLRKLASDFWCYSPPLIGVPGHTRWASAHRVNSFLSAFLIKRVMRQIGFRSPLIWAFNYDQGGIIRRLTDCAFLSIYDCGDNYEALAKDDRHRELVRRYEQESCHAADIVFACSKMLGETRRVHNPRTYEVNCAADLEFFGRARDSATEVPDDIARLPKPVLGYTGTVDPYKLRIDLIRHLAKAHPDWSIAFVGYIWYGFDKSTFSDLPNVHLLGGKPYDAFPGYLKGMDVCLGPFNINEVTRFGDQLKIYEYLAAGRPVVSTTCPAAERVQEVVHIADEPDQFMAAVEKALLDTPDAMAQRLQVVQAHSWANRVNQKWDWIRQSLTKEVRVKH